MGLESVILDSNDVQAVPWLRDLSWGVPISVANLPAGDIWARTEDAVLILERKTLSDLVASIKDGRIFDQAARMARASQWRYIMVTGMPIVRSGKLWVCGQITGWSWPAVQGALLTADDMGVPTVWVPTERGIHAAVHWLAGRKRGDITIKAPKSRRQATMQPAGEQLLTAIDGIGPKKAQALLDYGGSAAWALEALTTSEEEWPDAPELGAIRPSDRKAARGALGIDGEPELTTRVSPGDGGE